MYFPDIYFFCRLSEEAEEVKWKGKIIIGGGADFLCDTVIGYRQNQSMAAKYLTKKKQITNKIDVSLSKIHF